MLEEGEVISFRAVARRAGVSEGLVHDPQLKPLIAAARDAPRTAAGPRPRSQTTAPPSPASVAADTELLREDNRRLRRELKDLRERLRARLGEDSDPDLRLAAQRLATAENRAREMSLENTSLRSENTRLESQLEEAIEELAALRVAHSRLMKRINTNPSTATKGGSS